MIKEHHGLQTHLNRTRDFAGSLLSMSATMSSGSSIWFGLGFGGGGGGGGLGLMFISSSSLRWFGEVGILASACFLCISQSISKDCSFGGEAVGVALCKAAHLSLKSHRTM